jgi:hypothetical protein
MPRTSDRKRAINGVEQELRYLQKAAIHCELLDEEVSLVDQHHLHMCSVLKKLLPFWMENIS